MHAETEYPLKVGVVTHAPTYESSPPRGVVGYRIRSRDYDVVFSEPNRNETIGTARVIQTGPESFTVRLHFPLAFPPEKCRFWGAFSVGADRIAVLDDVYLVVSQ